MSKSVRRDFVLFMVAGALYGFYQGIYEPIFNNYLNDVFHIGEAARGALEFPREFPGFAVVFVSSLFLFLPDTRVAVVALLAMSLGLFGQGFFSPTMGWMMVWMVLWSIGGHLYMPMASSIGMSLAEDGKVGLRLGQLGAVVTAASLLGFGLVWVSFRFFEIGYRTGFVVAGAAGVLAAVFLWMMEPKRNSAKRRLVFKRKYGLFYLLNIVFGARKQIFITFGPWVLIQVFDQPVTTFAMLGLVGTVLGVLFKPALGKAIDVLGERMVIAAESLMLVFVCLGYGYARDLGLGAAAIYLVFVCYTADNLLFSVNMARATYLNKISDSPEDTTSTLAMGVTVDHAVSMTIPIFGGLLWAAVGYQAVFLVAAVIALLNFVLALRITVPVRAPLERTVSA